MPYYSYTPYTNATYGQPGQPAQPAQPQGPAQGQGTGTPAMPAMPAVPGSAPVAGQYPAQYPPYPQYPYYYSYPYGYPYGYYPYPYPMPTLRPPGETYALVVSWIVIVLGAISIILGMIVALIQVIAALAGVSNLAVWTTLLSFTLPPIVGGGLAVFYGITRVMKRSSRPVALPQSWLFIALTAVALVAGIVLWNINDQGPTLTILPLVLFSGWLPALAILAFGVGRLGSASSSRHLWLSLFYGATLAPLLAVILELILDLITRAFFSSFHLQLSSNADTNPNPNSGPDIIYTLILLSVIAPVVEEGLKPLGSVLIIRRIRVPAESFLLGLAAGIGFDLVETIQYIGSGGADWVTVAIGRIGAGLLHGVGAGFGALGWYYLINGRGTSYRWLRGFGFIAYAMFQHAFFNGSSLLYVVPGLGDFLNKPIYLGQMPMDTGTLLYIFYYILIACLLVFMVRWLSRDLQTRRAQAMPPAAAATPAFTAAGGAR